MDLQVKIGNHLSVPIAEDCLFVAFVYNGNTLPFGLDYYTTVLDLMLAGY